jgi:hypothetical protein
MSTGPHSSNLIKTNNTDVQAVSSISSLSSSFGKLRILMVSPEYPPINGGVGRYTYNLVQELKRHGVEVYVACDNRGKVLTKCEWLYYIGELNTLIYSV